MHLFLVLRVDALVPSSDARTLFRVVMPGAT